MELNGVKEAALLSWINSVCPEEPVNKITQMMDAHRLLKLASRVQGKESCDDLCVSPSPNMMEMIFSILKDDFQFCPRQASLMFRNISQGIDLELQIAKVVLVLCYCGFKKHNMVPLDTKTGLMIASMFHFIEDEADGLSLDDDLNKFLTKASVMTFSTSSSGSSCCSPSYTDDESPFTSRFQKPAGVQFQELVTVACSLGSSPVPDVMNTPQMLKRLWKKLAHEEDVRDELEKELSDQINIISEKEGLIIQLQHRVDRMLKEQRELEKDHKDALLELQEKNESLLHRVHEVVKQCQELKNENYQKGKTMDELTEENQTVSAQVRNAFAQLARAEEEVTKLTLAHESSQAEWRSRKEFLEHKLNEAVTHRECLSEQVQILQGKISVLEDELQKAQSQERGEVLGPIMEVDVAEKRLQEWRKVIDEDVRCRESVHKRPGFHLHVLDTPEKSTSGVSRTATVKSRHANRPSNSQPKQRRSVMFVIPNTPKSSGGASLLRRGLELRKEACRTPTVASRGLGPAISANIRSPRVSALRKRPRNKSPQTSNAKLVNSRIICGQTLDLLLSVIFLFVCLLFIL